MDTRSKFSIDPLLVERNSPESSLTALTFWQTASSMKETRERFVQSSVQLSFLTQQITYILFLFKHITGKDN